MFIALVTQVQLPTEATETSAQLVGLAPRGGSETICSTRTAVEPAGLSQRLPSTVHYKTRLHK